MPDQKKHTATVMLFKSFAKFGTILSGILTLRISLTSTNFDQIAIASRFQISLEVLLGLNCTHVPSGK